MLISYAKEQTIIHHEMKKIKPAKSAQFKTELHQNSQHLDHQKHCCKNDKQDADEENIL